MILGKATNLNTGAQSDEFIICADCYGSFDDAFCYANAQVRSVRLPMLLRVYVSSVGKTNATLVRDSAVRFRACVLYP